MAGGSDGCMKFEIEIDGFAITGSLNLFLALLQALPDYLNFLGSGSDGGESGGGRFNSQSNVTKVVQEMRIGTQFRPPAQNVGIELIPRRPGSSASAQPLARLDHSLVRQHFNSLTQDGSAHSELVAQFRFVRKHQRA